MILSRRTLLRLSAATSLVPFASTGFAAADKVATNRKGTAIQGYDSHAYWRHNAPREGLSDFVVNWRGVPWHFETQQDADIFAANPEAFEPQFGGFCTRAMSLKKIVDGDPKIWRIYEGKLYLFARPVGREYFDKGQDKMILKAHAHWDTLG